MAERRNVLIAIDDISLAGRINECLEPIIRIQSVPTVHLFHALGPLPPQLLESPGAEDPEEEEKIEGRQARQQEKWLEQAGARAEAVLQAAVDQIRALDPPDIAVQSHFVLLNHREDLVDEILKAAHDYGCEAVIVGHHTYPWVREQLHTHTGLQLKSSSPDLSVCVVNS